MSQTNFKVGAIKDVSGEVNIAGGDIYKGYTAEQVSGLLAQIISTFQPKSYEGRCPYKGLDDFEEEDAELFFGRELLVQSLVSRVKDSRVLFITGPSGSGKSSLVRAGLIPAWKGGAIKELHSEQWCYETIKPGRGPLETLTLAFSRLKSPELANYFREHINEPNILNECAESVLSGNDYQRFVLFVDQFEEIFTQITREEERLAFLNLLTHAVSLKNGRVILVLAMRSDFLSNCATYPKLNAQLNRPSAFVQIGSMRPDELVSAIAQPALRVGLRVDPDLIAQIINDMQGEPGALPLMQFTLRDLFDAQQAKGGVIALTLIDYLQHGGIHKSLERHADSSFAKLSETEQALARSIFSGLIEIGYGAQETRRTALFDELIPANMRAEDVLTVIQKLADARLVITDEQAGVDTVTISHEKLIDAWPWLRKLVNENREAIAFQNEIASDAKEWANRRDPSYLYTGARLAAARERIKNLTLSEKVEAFLSESITTQETVRRQGERRRRLTIWWSSGLAVLFFGLFIFSLIQLKISRAQQLGFQAQAAFAEQKYNAAALYAYQSNQIYPNDAGKKVLGDLPYQNFELGKGLLGHMGAVTSVAWSADGRLASGSYDNTIIIWNLTTGQPAQILRGHVGWISSVGWSSDGQLASGSRDNTIIIWDLSTGKPAQILQGHTDHISSVAWSPDGQLASASWDHTVIVWNLSTGQPAQILQGHTDGVNSVSWSADGQLASSSDDQTVIIWNLATSQPAQTLHNVGLINDMDWSFSGRLVTSSYFDKTVTIWDLTTGQPAQILQGHMDDVQSVAWSTDDHLASSSLDGTVILWDLTAGKPAQILQGHTSWVSSVAWSTDGRLVSGSGDGSIIVWDLVIKQPAQSLQGHTDDVQSVAWSSDGHLASGSYDNTIIIWDLSTSRPAQTLRGHTGHISSVAWSADGRLASGSYDGTVIIWNLSTGRPAQTLRGPTRAVNDVAWSRDGRLASGSDDWTVILWDLTTGQPAQTLKGHSGWVTSIAWSIDGRLASGSGDNSVIIWNLSTGEPAQVLQGHMDWITSVAWSTDGRLASGSGDGSIIVWDLSTSRPAQTLKGHTWIVNSVAWSTDGRLASGSGDTTVIIWDLSTGQPAQILKGHKNEVKSIAWSADGRLASGSQDRTIKIPRVDLIRSGTCDWLYRNMTASEWFSTQGVFSTYQPACPNLPVPKFNPINDILTAMRTGRIQELQLVLITWEGRIIVFGVSIIFLLFLSGVWRTLNKLSSRLWHKTK